MPVPAGPRRAAPPRKKAAAKAPPPAPAPIVPDEEVKESLPIKATSDPETAAEPERATSTVVAVEVKETEEKVVEEVNATPSQEEMVDSQVEKSPESPAKIPGEIISEEPSSKEQESTKAFEFDVPSVDPVPPSHAPDILEDVSTKRTEVEAEPERKPSLDSPSSLPTADSSEKLSQEPAEVPQELDEEAEEAARRKRVAEKLAKMGGINPFAPPPPVQRQSSSDVLSDETPSPAVTPAGPSVDSERESVEPVARKSSVDSTTAAPSSPLLSRDAIEKPSSVQPPSRKDSVESTRPGSISVSRKSSQDGKY